MRQRLNFTVALEAHGIQDVTVYRNLGVPDLYEEATRRRQGVPADDGSWRTWANPAACDERAERVARLFRDNFRDCVARVAPEVAAAGPRV